MRDLARQRERERRQWLLEVATESSAAVRRAIRSRDGIGDARAGLARLGDPEVRGAAETLFDYLTGIAIPTPAAYTEHRDNEIDRFLTERTLNNVGGSVRARVLYEAWREWVKTNVPTRHIFLVTETKFAREMEMSEITKIRRSAGYVYLGIGLLIDVDDT